MRKLTLALAVAITSIVITASGAYAYDFFQDAVNSTCGTNYGCGLCHVDPNGGGPLTTEGSNFSDSGFDPYFFCSAPPPTPQPACTDSDGDGYFVEADCGPAVDCNDNDATVHPGAPEICNDGKDNDCDGLVDCADPDCVCDSTGAAGSGKPKNENYKNGYERNYKKGFYEHNNTE